MPEAKIPIPGIAALGSLKKQMPLDSSHGGFQVLGILSHIPFPVEDHHVAAAAKVGLQRSEVECQ